MATNKDRRGSAARDELRRRLAFSIVWPPATCLSVCCAIVALFCQRLAGEALAAGVELPSLVPLLLTTAAFLVVATALLMFSARRFANRIAGPLNRIRHFVRDLGGGQPNTLTVREGDMLEGLASDLNRLAEQLDALPVPPGPTEQNAAEQATHPAQESRT